MLRAMIDTQGFIVPLLTFSPRVGSIGISFEKSRCLTARISSCSRRPLDAKLPMEMDGRRRKTALR